MALCHAGLIALKDFTNAMCQPGSELFMTLRTFLILTAIAAALAGCGKRGALEPAPDQPPYDPNRPAAIDPLIKPE
jgi:predicted small lipoprotein YifL